LSTIPSPLNAVAADKGSAPPVAARTAPSRVSQNSCASCWPGLTDMKAIRRLWRARSVHACSSDTGLRYAEANGAIDRRAALALDLQTPAVPGFFQRVLNFGDQPTGGQDSSR
jgi:hypothetical protein